MKNKKQMRNIFIKKIDDILIRYYKEMDFNLLSAKELPGVGMCYADEYHGSICYDAWTGEGQNYREKAMELIDLMRELDLVNAAEYDLLKEVYKEYFGLHKC